MLDLNELRAGWEGIEEFETRLLRAMTIQESLRHLAELQSGRSNYLQAHIHTRAGS